MKSYIDKSISYTAYLRLLDDLLIAGKTTGPVQSEAMTGYARLNLQRMNRIGKTVELAEATRAAVRALDRKMIWLTITEGWCGDAAQNIPVIEKIAAENPLIETRYLLRGENVELIDRFLTAGARAIPKLIALDAKTLQVVGTWGARPASAQRLYDDLRSQGVQKALIMENLQRWYNGDKTNSIQREFFQLLNSWRAAGASVAGV